MNASDVASIYLASKRARELAEKAEAEAKALVEREFALAGVVSVEVNGMKVSLVEAFRRSFDVEALRGLVSDSVFDAITKVAVEPKAWDKARKAGSIADIVENEVVSGTAYVRLQVQEIATSAEVSKAS